MVTNSLQFENRLSRNKGREVRTQSIATRFTRAEEQALLKRAEASGKNLREWAREVLLRAENTEKRYDMEMHIFAELVGMQMILMNALSPLLNGETRTKEEVRAMFQQIQKSKVPGAQEILARRAQQASQK
jgi:DNA polymerase elongation subunit (family B)